MAGSLDAVSVRLQREEEECRIASREPVPLMTQLVVLHAARPASFAGGLGFKFSANADSKPPTHSAAMAQQIRLSAPRNISSLKLCQIPCLNILVLFAIVAASA